MEIINVTIREIQESKDAYENSLERYNRIFGKIAENWEGITDVGGDVQRNIVYAAEDYVVFLGAGHKDLTTEVRNDSYGKLILMLRGTAIVRWKHGQQEVELNKDNRYIEIPPFVDYDVENLEEDGLGIVVLVDHEKVYK